MGAIRRFFESPPIGYLSWLYGGTTDGINLLDKVTTDPLDPVQVVRKVLELNGTSDRLVVNNSSGLGNFGSSDFTLEFTADLTDTSTEKAIVSKWTGSGNQRSWFTMVDAMGRLSLFTSADGSTTKTAYIDKASVPQRITSVVIAKSGASATASFDGGAPIAFSGDVVSSIYTSTSSIYISTINAGIAYYFSGKIARAKVAGIFEYAFEESAGTTIYDISGNGNDGTLTGGTWTTAQGIASPQARDGFSPMLCSDAVDDYVDTGIVPTLHTKVECGFIVEGDIDGGVFGTNTGGFGAEQRFGLYSSAGNTVVKVATPASYPSFPGSNKNVYNVGIIDAENNLVSLNGTAQAVDYTALATAQTIWLFGTRTVLGSSCIKYFKHWESGVLLHNFVAQADGTFLETVNNVVYSNDGTGSLEIEYIPALLDGTTDVLSGDIINPGGLLHNGGSYELVHTDASQNTDPFWSDGAGTLLNKSYADFVAQIAARTDADEWRFTQTADDLIEEGTFYSQALTGLALSHLKVYHERYE